METPALPPEYLVEDNSALLFRTCIAFLVLETVFMATFYMSQYLSKERPNLWMATLMTLTYISCALKIALAFLMVRVAGAGRHLQALSPHTIVNSRKLGIALTLVCPLTTAFSKLGVLCFLDRIFSDLCRIYRIVIRSIFALVLATTVAQFNIGFFNCRPFSSTWDLTTPRQCSIPTIPFYRFMDLPNIITTFVIFAIPIPGLFSLHHTRAVKMGLAVVFSVCVLAIVAAAMRFKAFLDITQFADISYDIVKPLSWTIAKSGLYLMVGVMLTLRPLLRQLFNGTRVETLIIGTPNAETPGGPSQLKCSRRWFKAEDPVFLMEKNRRSLSDASGGTIVRIRAEMAISSTADARW